MDTAQRSLSHWSEAGRTEMDAFYRVAGRDYRLLAEALDWGALLAGHADAEGRVRLLDVACGSGRFPAALTAHADLPGELHVAYDLLDPSAFSVREARSRLAPPFHAAAEHECTLQDLPSAAGPYDVVWATHALYALPAGELRAGLRRYVDALAPARDGHPGGVGVIAHAAATSHYVAFYPPFLADFHGGVGTPYTAAEQIVEALEDLGVRTRTIRLDYHGEVPFDDRATLEGYLQRCAFNGDVPLEAMEAAPTLGPYLAACRDEAAGAHRFPQAVDLVLFGADGPPSVAAATSPAPGAA